MICEETAALLQTAAEWQSGGTQTAVAVVAKTWNSAPRPVGARMAVGEDGRFAGSVSGGCVEKEVIFAARECMRDNACRLLSFGVADETAWREGLACGGGIEILTAPFPPARSAARKEIAKLLAAIAKRKECALQTCAKTGAVKFYKQADAPAAGFCGGVLTEHFPPRRRLFIIGATHIAQALAPLAAAADFAPLVIDPRSAWAAEARFPNTPRKICWPQDALQKIKWDRQTALVALAHDPKIDDPALIAALRGGAGYVGALGSKQTHEKRRRRLMENGIGEELLARIHAPVGLDIGATTAGEIALSVAAQLVSHYSRA